LRESDERLVEIVTMRAGDRVVRRLRALAQESGTGRINLSQDELAALSATSRSAVAQVLSQLRAAGAITTARRSIEVVDIAKLESIDPLTLTTD
ncbi:MAG TPA: helix-turn-helix domain-containing protein, partial [Microthrixaceae bacterium]|nr:helix-turn-helix domain-containing protein [Microthrixaceae bacterium]